MPWEDEPCSSEKSEFMLSIVVTIVFLFFFGMMYFTTASEKPHLLPVVAGLIGLILVGGSIMIAWDYHKYRECRFEQLIKEAVEEAIEKRK